MTYKAMASLKMLLPRHFKVFLFKTIPIEPHHEKTCFGLSFKTRPRDRNWGHKCIIMVYV